MSPESSSPEHGGEETGGALDQTSSLAELKETLYQQSGDGTTSPRTPPGSQSPLYQPREAIAADIKAIHAIILAAAKSFSVEIPIDTHPLRNLEILQPRAEDYDEQAIITYQIKQLPTVNLINTTVPPGTLPFESPQVEVKRFPLEESSRGFIKIFEWRLDNQILLKGQGLNPFLVLSHIRFDEFGYTPEGHICSLTTRVLSTVVEEHVFISGDQNRSPAWEGQRFGTEWKLVLDSRNENVSIARLSWVYLQLSSRIGNAHYDLENRAEIDIQETRSGSSNFFIRKFWYDWKSSIYGMPVEFWTPFQDIVLQYHIRTFKPLWGSTSLGTPKTTRKRVKGVLEAPGNKKIIRIEEHRCSVALKTTWAINLPIFYIATLYDNSGQIKGIENLSATNQWRKLNIKPFGRSTGVAAFALRIYSIIDRWNHDWWHVLNNIEQAVGVDLQDILSHERRLKLMYDDTGFELSEFYFAILQTLRLASDWIQESMDDLSRLVDTLEENCYSPQFHNRATFLPKSPEAQALALEVSKHNWGIVISHQRRLGGELLSRISKKKDEVQSLRDGLFSATAISESTKSSQLNHYILVFTIVTIFYLPLGFVTALFALDLVKSQPNQTAKFSVTTAVVAITTYAFSGFFIWVVRNPSRRQKLTRPGTMLPNLGELFRPKSSDSIESPSV